MTNLIRMINSTYNQVASNLQILEQEDIIKTCRVGQVRLVKLNIDNPRTIALLQALEMLDVSKDALRTKS